MSCRSRAPVATLLAAAALAVAGCSAVGVPATDAAASARPGFPRLGAAVPAGTTAYSNASLARLLAVLVHDLEWGEERPVLVRFEAPVRVALDGPGAAAYRPFLADYLGFLAAGTGIDIAPGEAGDGEAAIAARFVDAREFARVLPAAACVVAPGEVSWRAFRRRPSELGGEAMRRERQRDTATIFLPAGAPPHLVRGCLIEEVAQALGPANDLYGLGPSIFNDDAAHRWPTRLDLLMLRTLYQPEFATGLDRAGTERAARAALDRIHPEGRAGARDLAVVPDGALRGWREVTARAFSPEDDAATRERRARAALAIAARDAAGSAQHCQSLVTWGRALAETRPGEALEALAEARRVCAAVHGPGDIRLARIGLEAGFLHFGAGDPRRALAASEGLDAVFAGHRQEDRLARLYALRARAFRAIQQGARAFEAGRLAAEWTAYAFGGEDPGLLRRLAGLASHGTPGGTAAHVASAE